MRNCCPSNPKGANYCGECGNILNGIAKKIKRFIISKPSWIFGLLLLLLLACTVLFTTLNSTNQEQVTDLQNRLAYRERQIQGLNNSIDSLRANQLADNQALRIANLLLEAENRRLSSATANQQTTPATPASNQDEINRLNSIIANRDREIERLESTIRSQRQTIIDLDNLIQQQ